MSFKDAMALGGISQEEFQALPPADVSPLVVSPTNDPSSTIPVPASLPSDPVVVEEVAVDPVAVIDEDPVIQATDNIIAEHQVIQERADEIIALQQSMEKYAGLIRKSGARGITAGTAEFLKITLLQAKRNLDIETKIGSMESFNDNGPRERDELASIALEDIRTTAKAAGNKFLKIVEQFIAYIRKYGMQLIDGITTVESQLNELEKELQSNKNAGGDGKQIFVQNIQYLSAGTGGKISLVPPGEINGLAHFTATAYPEAVIKYFDGLTKGVLKYDAEEGNDEELDAIFEAAAKPLAFLIEQKISDDILPGGFKLDVSKSGLSVGVIKAESGESEGGKLETLPTVELRKAVRGLKELVVIIKDIRPESEKVSKAGDKLIAAIKRKNADSVSDKASTLVAQSSPRIGEIIGYLIRYIKISMTVINAMNKANGSEAE